MIDLPWLPPAPADFRSLCLDIEPGDHEALRFFAGHALDLNQLNSLAKAAERVCPHGEQPGGMLPLRLALLGNGTTSLLVPAIKASALRHGVLLDVIEAPYDQAIQMALDPSSAVNAGSPQFALLAYDQHLLVPPEDMSDPDEAAGCIDVALDQIETIRNGISASSAATIIVQTMPAPAAHLVGSFDSRLPGSPRALAAEFNRRLVDQADRSGDLLLDVASLAETVGLDIWHDPTLWNLAKLAFAQAAVPLYADHVARVIAASRGKSRKCLVLDLDNTLWGGVIGDDGLDGIVLGQGDATGEAHVEIQRTAKQLRGLGVILAVSSKNDDANARLPFRQHPDMLLQEDDIAIFQANWSDKASNLEAIAKALDIGLDSLVLLDDNPAERAQVRDALPAVAVPELPNDPALFSRMLLAAGYFDTVALSREDLLRADDYTARAKRIELRGATRDLSTYLESLDMEILFGPFDTPGRNRIAQLINKSNQFNLTGRRYSETEVARHENDPSIFTLQVRLRDRFGDNGMISVVICREEATFWDIDTWLMSCRVLGRGVEMAVLGEIARNASARGISELRGYFIPSGRNDMVRDHYAKLGFEQEGDYWRLDVARFEPAPVQMRVIRA